MVPYYAWVLRLWCFDIKWKTKGLNRLEVRFLSRKGYFGKYQLRFFKNRYSK